MLLQAYDEEDPEAAKVALNNPFIKHMDVEYAILARDMPLPEQSLTIAKPAVNQNAQLSSAPVASNLGNSIEANEEEDEENLC